VRKESCFSQEAGNLEGKWTDVSKTIFPVQAKLEGFRGEGMGEERGLHAREAGAQAVSPVSARP